MWIGRDLKALHQPQKLFGDEFYKQTVVIDKIERNGEKAVVTSFKALTAIRQGGVKRPNVTPYGKWLSRPKFELVTPENKSKDIPLEPPFCIQYAVVSFDNYILKRAKIIQISTNLFIV
jgi:hypothetical protein